MFDKMPPELPRVVSIGRLDLQYRRPAAVDQRWRARAPHGIARQRLDTPLPCARQGPRHAADLEKLKYGVEIDGVRYGPIEATIDSVQGANMWLTIAIREGKNREVRKILRISASK